MSAALRPARRSPFKKFSPGSSQTAASRLEVARKPAQSRVQQLPSREKPPHWIRSLLFAQQASIITTFVLAGTVLSVYGWTVYTQQLWSQEYQKLEQLRRTERQLTTNGEVLKNQIAKQADRPGATLVPQTPSGLVFLKPAPARTSPPASTTAPPSSPIAPLGY